jgi:hypothetical protein
MTVEARILPMMIAPNDNPTFANMFNPKIENCLLSNRFIDSRAKEDMVVRAAEPNCNKEEVFCIKIPNNRKY